MGYLISTCMHDKIHLLVAVIFFGGMFLIAQIPSIRLLVTGKSTDSSSTK